MSTTKKRAGITAALITAGLAVFALALASGGADAGRQHHPITRTTVHDATTAYNSDGYSGPALP